MGGFNITGTYSKVKGDHKCSLKFSLNYIRTREKITEMRGKKSIFFEFF